MKTTIERTRDEQGSYSYHTVHKGQLPIQSTDTHYQCNVTRNEITIYPITHCQSITVAAYYEERKLSQNRTTE